jgi:predicted nucleic acid-binding protein
MVNHGFDQDGQSAARYDFITGLMSGLTVAGDVAVLIDSSKKIEFNDCLIAATACSPGMREIVTRNIDHFNRITGFAAIVPEKFTF